MMLLALSSFQAHLVLGNQLEVSSLTIIPCCMAQAGLEFIGLVIDSLASFVAEITVVYHQAWQCVP